MQTNFFPLVNEGIEPLDQAALISTCGGSFSDFLMDAAAFLVAPGFGFFHLGVKAGIREAAAAD